MRELCVGILKRLGAVRHALLEPVGQRSHLLFGLLALGDVAKEGHKPSAALGQEAGADFDVPAAAVLATMPTLETLVSVLDDPSDARLCFLGGLDTLDVGDPHT